MAREFGEWIQQRLDNRRWNQADFCRAAGIADATLSRIMSGTRAVGPDVTTAIARALGEPPDRVFRAAGLLPPVPPPVSEEQEALHILRQLPGVARDAALAMLRGLARQAQVVPFVADDTEGYSALNEPLVRELLAEFRRVPQDWQEFVINQMRQYRQMADVQARVIGEEDDGGERATGSG